MLCDRQRQKKNGQALAGKENKLIKKQNWKKHFGHATWKKRQGLVKREGTGGEAIFQPSKMTEKD